MIGPDQIRKSEKLIRPYIRKTPVLTIRGKDFDLDTESVLFKLELFHHSGSFKPRGAFTNMLMRNVPECGVVAASGGNHGAAVAYAAMILQKPARIFVPSVASPAKMDRIRSYGADLVVAGERYADALEASEEWVRKSGALPVHAYDQPETLMGQGTLGMELQEQASSAFDTLLIAVGGGGLIGGVAAWFEGKIRIVAVEPESAPTLDFAMRAGKPVDAPAGGIAADSLAPKRVGELMFPIAQKYVQQIVLVSDQSIAQAQLRLWERCRILAEPGGAAALAALLSRQYTPQLNERVGVILCGGNTNKMPSL